jgi:hypothetical protein
MCDIAFDRSILQLSNGIRHIMPSTDRMLELTAKHRWLRRLTSGCVFQWANIIVTNCAFLNSFMKSVINLMLIEGNP